MTVYTKAYKKLQTKTPQTQKLAGEKMVKNAAGGFVYKVSPLKRVERFLILGNEGGTYYASEQKLTKQNAKNLIKCIETDGEAVVDLIVSVSHNGRAPKNDPAIFALALAAKHGDDKTRRAAYAAVPNVLRTGTHLFQFRDAIEAVAEKGKGVSRGFRTAVAEWYLDKTIDQLAYQLVKYQQRDGVSQRDILRIAHPFGTPEQNKLFDWAVGRGDAYPDVALPRLVQGFERIKVLTSPKKVAATILEYGLPREAVPTQFLNEPDVWEALLQDMPMTALLRNLANLTRAGVIGPNSDGLKRVVAQFTDTERLRKARVHPLSILTALLTYSSGHGFKGTNTWTPVQRVVDTLNDAFYASFGNIKSTGRNYVLGIDVSGSMAWGQIAGMPITPNVAAATMALITAHTEPNHFIGGFATQWVDLGITPKDRLDTAAAKAQRNFGGTDCAIAMKYALQHKIPADVFVIYTDNETWAGEQHAKQALNAYRDKTGIPAKLISVAFTASKSSIADPNDAGMLDVVGFDTAAPNVMADFVTE